MALDGKKVTFIHTLTQMKFALKYPTIKKELSVYKWKKYGKKVIEGTNYSTINFSNNKHSVLYRYLCINYVKKDYLGKMYQKNREASTLLATNNGYLFEIEII